MYVKTGKNIHELLKDVQRSEFVSILGLFIIGGDYDFYVKEESESIIVIESLFSFFPKNIMNRYELNNAWNLKIYVNSDNELERYKVIPKWSFYIASSVIFLFNIFIDVMSGYNSMFFYFIFLGTFCYIVFYGKIYSERYYLGILNEMSRK